ncbi:carbon-nitrogen hydrolase [Lineolata rhizophorae]|uniref:Carbon-nitrogen hydrolase n=1 Tax=Lineolata rhizophorae TaxID=578093 RepID=A0A6A6P1C8_9PEZI|nr:carbon-nitrogen hydrolase [Lineolata rhizophorae]
MLPFYKIAPTDIHPSHSLAYSLQIEADYKKAAEFIESAAAQGADLAVLPEYHLTSWVPENIEFFELCDVWEEYLEKCRKLAREHGICVLLNVTYFIDNRGDIIENYVKKNLWGPEREHLSRSGRDRHDDLAFPEAFCDLIYEGAKIIIVPTFITVFFTSAGGRSGQGYAVLSQVTVPYIGALAWLGSCGEGMSMVDLDLGILDVAEEKYCIRADRCRPD